MSASEYYEKFGALLLRWGIYHFTAHEAAPIGRLAGGHKLQVPPQQLWEHAILTLLRLERLRALLRADHRDAVILVNSGYRDSSYNRAVGSTNDSMHLEFNAFDFRVLRGPTRPEVWAAMLDDEALFPDRDRFGIGIYPTFVHLDTRGYLGRQAPARW